MAFDKIVDSTALDTALTNIADAIRNKTGGTDPLTLEQMPGEIEGIETGTTGKPYVDTSKITNFGTIFQDNNFPVDELQNIDTKNVTKFNYMFSGCSTLTTIPLLDTSNGTDFRYMFQNCSSLTKVPLLDMSKATNCEAIFYNCTNLTDLTIKVNSLKPNYYMFDYCHALTNVTIEGTIKITNNSFRIDYSDNLTVESIMNFINAFEDNSSLSTTYTVYFGKTNLDKLTDEQKAVATAKNIALA